MQEFKSSKNGIAAYGYRNNGLHGCQIALYVKSGCMYERPEENGITHFLEHVLYRNVNAIMGGALYTVLDREALEFSASTYNEMMQFTVFGDGSSFNSMAKIITLLLSPIVLSKEEFLAERGRVKAEIRESDDRTSLQSFVSSIVYEGTPLSGTILGTLGGISKITRERLENYRVKIFNRNNIFFCVTGNFTDENLEYLTSLAGEHELDDGAGFDNTALIPEGFFHREKNLFIKNADFTMLRFSFDMDMTKLNPGEDDLLYDILLGGNNSRFYMEMSEKRGLLYDVSGSVEKYKNIGSFSFSYEVRAGTVYDAVTLTLSILSDLKRRLVAEEDTMKSGYVKGASLLLDDARELGAAIAYDTKILSYPYSTVEERSALYASITPQRIREAAREIFKRENLVLGIKGNKRKIDTQRLEKIISDFDKNN